MRAPLSCNIVDRYAVRYFFAGAPAELYAGLQQHFAQCTRCSCKLRLLERVWRWDGQRRGQDQDGLSATEDTTTMGNLSTRS